MKNLKCLLCIFYFILLSCISYATIINVPADQPTIQQGLTTATEGDTVLVATGTYYENLFWPTTNGIKLLSEPGADNTIIDGSNTSIVIYIFGVTIDTTTIIDGFTFQNGTADSGGGISCINASPKVENCIIRNNEGGGCTFTNSISAILRNNEVKENNGIGIKCVENSNLTVTSCDVENNNGSGIYFHSSSGSISDCFISDNSANSRGGGIYCDNNSNPSLENVILTNNSANSGGGISCRNTSNPSLENVTISNNSVSYDGGGIFCENYSSPSLVNVTITANSAGFGGGIFCWINSNPSLDNVTISNNYVYDNGGGISCRDASPSLVNVTITGNSTSVSGGGIFCDYGSSPSLENVTITDNSASDSGGGICCDHGSSPSFVNVTISRNLANSSGGGISCYQNSSPSLLNVTISDNSANYFGGGIYCSSGNLGLVSTTITLNLANMGGAIYSTNSNPVVEHCTITENSATEEGNAIYTENGSELTVQYTNIMLNDYGIFNNDPSVMIDANNCYWGHETGPYHFAWNPNGLGDSVNQYVNPIPFLTEADINAPPIPPYGLDILAVGDDYVSLIWQNSPIGDLLGYKVYFDSDSSGFPYADTVDVILDTTYTFSDLTALDTIYVAVTCYDNSGEESWYSREIIVTLCEVYYYPPSANFISDITEGYTPLTINFTDLSAQGTGIINQWYWDFGDDNNSTLQNPIYEYLDPGIYSVSLTVTDENDSTDTEDKINYITVFGNEQPSTPTDININISGNNVNIIWSPVYTTINGYPINVDAYLIYISSSPYSDFSFHDLSTDTTYTHQYVTQFSDNVFYQVTSYVGDLRFLKNVIIEYPNLKLGEIDFILKNRRN